MSVELPATAGNEYQDLHTEIAFIVEAVQGNADVENDEVIVTSGGTPEENGAALVAAIDAVSEGGTVYVAAGEFNLSGSITIPSGVSLYGAQCGVSAAEWATDPDAQKTIITSSAPGSSIIVVQQTTDTPVSDVVIDGVMVNGGGVYTKAISVSKEDGEAITGIAIRNNAVVNFANDGIEVGNADGAVIENNYIEGVFDNAIKLSNYNNTTAAYIRNNIIKNVGTGVEGGSINGAIMITEGVGDVVVVDNSIEVFRSNHESNYEYDVGESAIVVKDVSAGGVITIKNNILNDVEKGIGIYKFSAVSEGDKVVIQNNTIKDAEDFAIATSSLNFVNYSDASRTEGILTVVEINDNQFEGAVPALGNIYIEKTNIYGQTTFDWKVIVGDVEYTDETENVQVIASAEELIAFAQSVNDGTSYANETIVLANDIDLENEEWTPIGNASAKFSGTFDGNGKTISNLKITRGLENIGANNRIGLFGVSTSSAVLKNFTVNNADVSGSLNVAVVLGGGGGAEAKISNVHVSGKIEVYGYRYVGAILGKGYSTIENCSVIGDSAETSYVRITGGYAGGVVGYMGEGNNQINGCTVKNITVEGASNGVGGVSGILHYGNMISGCTLENVVVWQTDSPEDDRIYCGAFAGTRLDNNGASIPTVKDCVFSGKLYSGAEKTDVTAADRYVGDVWYGTTTSQVTITGCVVSGSEPIRVTPETAENLQSIIDEAPAGAIIYLAEGEYDLNGLDADKTIYLIGAGQDKTIFKVTGSLNLSGENIIMSGIGITFGS